ncbi:MAG: glycosyltransferase family 4 protein [Bacteroidetes bacterium]|nr:glycosyltransferase family 4 protein [Bacteroidota bacterium]
MKVLFVSFGILPNRGAAAFVTESLANNFGPDEMTVVGERIMGLGTNPRPENVPRYYYILSNFSWKGRGKRFFLPFRWLIFPFVVLWLSWIARKEKCDYVLGSYPDNYYLYASYVAAKWMKLPFSSYFHNTYLENRKPGSIHRWFAERIQPKVFDYSDYVFVMSEGMQALWEERYPNINKFVPLIHTFEEWPVAENPTDVSAIKERYDFLLIGNFNNSNVESTARLVHALKKDERINIKMFTHVPRSLLQMRGIDVDAIDYRGFVKQEDFYKELMDNDVCVLTHGFTGGYTQEEYETIFPTRTINFLISGLPIFAHSPPFAFLSTYLKKYDCAEVVEEASEEAVLERARFLLDHPERRVELAANARKAAAQFYGPNVAANLKEKLLNARS